MAALKQLGSFTVRAFDSLFADAIDTRPSKPMLNRTHPFKVQRMMYSHSDGSGPTNADRKRRQMKTRARRNQRRAA